MNTRIVIIAVLLLIWGIPAQAQWVQTNGPYGATVQALAVIGTNLFAGTYAAGVYCSTDNGTRWTADTNGMGALHVDALAVIGTNLFAGIYDSSGGVYLSTDTGRSWTAAASAGLTGDALFVQALAVIGTNLFAGTYNGVYRSTDSGTSWRAATTGLPAYTHVLTLAVSGTNLLAGTYGGVFRSTDDGTNWTAANSGLTNTAVPALAVKVSTDGRDTNLFAGTCGAGVFRSTDNGTSWDMASTGLRAPGSVCVLALAVIGTNLFGGSEFDDVFRSTDNGKSWDTASTGLPASADVHAFAVCSTYLFAGTNGDGVWRRPLSEMIGQSGVQETLRVTQPLRSYPNPLSESTTISFTPESSGYADISIVNLLGTEVAHLFSGELSAMADGEHSFTWSPKPNVPDGMYECVIRMNGRVEKLPMMILH